MAPVKNGRLLFNENAIDGKCIPAQVSTSRGRIQTHVFHIGNIVPGKTTVYDESQTIDLDTVPLDGGFLLKVLVLSVDPGPTVLRLLPWVVDHVRTAEEPFQRKRNAMSYDNVDPAYSQWDRSRLTSREFPQYMHYDNYARHSTNTLRIVSITWGSVSYCAPRTPT